MSSNEFPGVIVLSNDKTSGTLAGPPHILQAIAASFGFKHRGGDRLGLTAPKMARLGLADAVGVAPNWRALSGEAITALWRSEWDAAQAARS